MDSTGEPPALDLVVAWLPAEDRSWSLLADAPSVLPALLYADKITLICPESDDFILAHSRKELGAELDRWARSRSIEAALSADILRRLPTPSPGEAPWATVAELRRTLRKPLQRFRIALAKVSQAADAEPLNDDDFAGFAETIFRTEVAPALDELDELTQEASLRSVFVSDVTADPYSYVGPGLGLLSASGDMPALIAAAVGATTPLARTAAHVKERRRALRHHDYLFLQKAQAALRDS